MNMSVSGPGSPTTQAVSTDPSKTAEMQQPSTNAALPQNNNDSQYTRYSSVKEVRDWLNSVMWGVTLVTGLYMTYSSLYRSNFKEVAKALADNDADIKEVVKALEGSNKQIAELIKQNNESVRGAIDENTRYLKEVIKVLDEDGNGSLSEAEIKKAQALMEEAKQWKKFTDAVNEAIKKK